MHGDLSARDAFMKAGMESTRRELLRSVALFGAAFIATRTLAACTFDNAESTGQTEDALVACEPATIGSNHGHSLVVPPADVAAAVGKTYSIKGGSGHDHLVTLSASHFATLAAGRSVTVGSSNVGGHTHSVTVTCAASSSRDGGVDASQSSDASVASDGGAAGCGTTSISANHGHALSVSIADLQAGAEKTYSIKGASGHPHAVTLTVAHFETLRSGSSITVTSSNVAGHTHAVSVSCA
jgi:hypothetical protein